VSSRQQTRARVAEPFASAPDENTIDFHVPTTPGFSTGARVSLETAQALIDELQEAVRKAMGKPKPGEPRLIIHTDREGMLWERTVIHDDTVIIVPEDHALLSYLQDVAASGQDIKISVRR